MTNVNLIYGNYAAIRQPELQCASSTKLIYLPLNSYIQMKLSLKKKKVYEQRFRQHETDRAILQAWVLQAN